MKAYPKRASEVVCLDCKKAITSNDDLIVVNKGLSCAPLHAACYGKSMRPFLRYKAINGWYYTVLVIFSGAVGFVAFGVSLFFFVQAIARPNLPGVGSLWGIGIFFILFALIFFFPLKLRMDSIRKYENRLPK